MTNVRRLSVVLFIASVWCFEFTYAVFAHDVWTNGEKVDPITKFKCCGESDCHLIPVDGLQQVDGGWEIKLHAAVEPDFVSNDRVQPSPDGQFWACEWGGQVRCFFAPMSTQTWRTRIVNTFRNGYALLGVILKRHIQ
jgi:hypothetical protein